MKLNLQQFKDAIQTGSLVVDNRTPVEFTQGFVPGSLFIGHSASFEEWVNVFLERDKPLVLVTLPGDEEKILDRFKNAGYNHVKGALDGGFATWQAAGERVDMIIDVEPDELAMDLPHDEKIRLIDVRKPMEYADGHIAEAENLSLADLQDAALIGNFEENENLYIHCKSGHRSVIASSIFKQHGFHNLRNVLGGFDAIKETEGFKIEKDQETLN